MTKSILRRTPKSRLFGAEKKVKSVEARAKKRAKILKKKQDLGILSLDKPPKSVDKLKGLAETIVTINGTHYAVKYPSVPIATDIRKSKLLLWSENSRNVDLAPDQKRPSQIQLFQILAARNDVKSLAAAMKLNGGPNRGEGPPIAVPAEDGKYEIIEGNERLVAAILNAQEDPETFKTMSIQVFQGLTKADALALLDTIHGKGKSPHPAVKIARLRYNALRASGMSPREYAKSLGLSITNVNISLAAYNMCSWYTSHYDSVKGDKTYTYFTKLVSQSCFRDLMGMSIAEEYPEKRRGRRARAPFDPMLGTNSEFFKQFCEWLAANKLNDCIQVDSLQTMLNDPNAEKVFLKPGNDFHDAWEVVKKSRPEFKSVFWADLYSLRELFTNMSDADLKDLLSCSDESPSGKLWNDTVKQFKEVEKKRNAS